MKLGEREEGASNREVLGAIIAERLELEEEWRPQQDFTYFSGKIKNKLNFEQAFKSLLEIGCRWDVMLTCLARALTYNQEKVPQPPRMTSTSSLPIPVQDSKGNWLPEDTEDPLKLKPSYRPKIMPPAAKERERVSANLKAASSVLNRYDTLLFELSAYLPFQDTGLGPDITSVEAYVLLPRLLRWAEKLLTEQTIGNARTIERVGELVPCVYVELMASRRKGRATQTTRGTLPWLKHVAQILQELEGGQMLPSPPGKKKIAKPAKFSNIQLAEAKFTNAQLAEAMRRFERDYPGVHRQLSRKLRSLHNQPRPKANDWHQAYKRDIADQ
jgi:hypothetical protein